MSSNTFVQEDLQALVDFGKLIISRAKFSDLTVQEAVQLNKHLQSYNQVVRKVEANILEVIRVTDSDVSDEKKSPKKAK